MTFRQLLVLYGLMLLAGFHIWAFHPPQDWIDATMNAILQGTGVFLVGSLLLGVTRLAIRRREQ